MEPAPAAERRWVFAAAVGTAVALGAWLRLLNLDAQILGGDELHALYAAHTLPLREILTTYEHADKSIPLTALLRLALEAGWRPGEMELRTPSLLAGLTAIAVLPWLVRRALGAGVATVFAFWLAVSPGLVLYSRIVRSYMPMVLLACLAAVAFERWWQTGRRRFALAYVALGTGAMWLHLAAGPFVAAPLLFAALWRSWERIRGTQETRRRGPAWVAVLGIGFALACFSLSFLLPAQESLAVSLADRRQELLPSAVSWLGVLRLQAGVSHGPGSFAFGALALLGLVLWARRQPRLAAYSLVLVACQVAGLLWLRPFRFQHALILNRYLLPCLPILLLWATAGIVLPWCTWAPPRLRHAGAAATACAVLGALVAAGPLGEPAFRESAFVHHHDFVGFHRRPGWIQDEALPAFYRELPTNSTIVEAPWDTWWNFARIFRVYQERTRADVKVSGNHPALESDAFDLGNFVKRDPDALAATAADWVVVHLDVLAEEDRIHEPPGALRAGIARSRELARGARLQREGTALALQLESHWGPADYEEPGLRAWRLPRPGAASP